jgi:nucleotidyltransferase substrate binding protein (TIGR01987 family)
MAGNDIRWLQRFDNVQRALLVLERGIELAQTRELSELEQQGVAAVVGSRDATRLAFQNGLIRDGETWMAMIRSRNQSSHTYNLEQAQAIARDVISLDYPAFSALNVRFTALAAAVR